MALLDWLSEHACEENVDQEAQDLISRFYEDLVDELDLREG
ncbi:hypothetical protein [Tropicibacter sp. Alg240-R139]|nr:hypothetical protein [Tropicibacter sp. Alg240-R139]